MVENLDNKKLPDADPVPFPGGDGMKMVKKPTKAQMEKICEKLSMDNQGLVDYLNTAGIILCAIHRATNRLIDEMGGDIIMPSLEEYKNRLKEMRDISKNYSDWAKDGKDDKGSVKLQG